MIEKENDYISKALQEGEFWGQVTREALEHGVPPWVDRRQSHGFRRERSGPFDDVTMAEIISGEDIEFLLRRATEVQGGKVLDLGCGSGWLSLELARRGLHVEGVDLAEEGIRIAQTYADTNSSTEGFGSATYRVADLNSIEIEPAKYDVVIAHAALHHVLELERLFQQVASGLKPGGQFLSLDDVAHTPRRVQAIVAVFYLLVPNDLHFWQRGRRLYQRLTEKLPLYRAEELSKEISEVSPFEAVQGPEIIPLVRKYFAVERIERRIAFVEFAAFHLSRGNGWCHRHRYGILKILARLDRVLVRCRLLPGKSALIVTRKQSAPGGTV